MHRLNRSAILLAVGLAIVPGCGERQPTRSEVSGTVTFQGKPIEAGDIVFQPVDGEWKKFYAQGKIVNGKYEFKQLGPVIGNNRVEVHGYKRTGRKTVNLAGKDLSKATEVVEELVPYIPPEYNEGSTLTVEINPGVNENVNFDL
ncbi:MAG: hypothetical protein WD851_13680 [Pirellulales bacterium]